MHILHLFAFRSKLLNPKRPHFTYTSKLQLTLSNLFIDPVLKRNSCVNFIPHFYTHTPFFKSAKMLRAGISKIAARNGCLSKPLKSNFHTYRVCLAAPAATKSKGSFTNKSVSQKTKKGSGNHKNFIGVATSSKYSKTSPAAPMAAISELRVPDLEPLTVVKYPSQSLRSLHHFGSFQKSQFNELFPQPMSLVRESVTLPLRDFYEKSSTNASSGNRLILTGESGIGKSVAISQLQSMAKSSGSIVLPINNCDVLGDGSLAFVYNGVQRVYQQPSFTKKLLRKILKGNKAELAKLKLSSSLKLEATLAKRKQDLNFDKGSTWANVLEKALSANVDKSAVFNRFVADLQSQQDFPVYLTVDNFSAFTERPFTAYKDQDCKAIYFDKFELPRFIMNFVTGKSAFNRGGVVVATCGKHKQNDTLPVALGKKQVNSYASLDLFDPQMATYLTENGGLKELEVSKLLQTEVGALVECYEKFEILQADKERDADELTRFKYVTSGNGNPLEMLKSCVINYI